jgi:hypothetical protein
MKTIHHHFLLRVTPKGFPGCRCHASWTVLSQVSA